MVNLVFLLTFCLALQLGVIEGRRPDEIFAETNADIQVVRDDGRIIVGHDMVLSPRQYRALYQKPLGTGKGGTSKRGLNGDVSLWPNNRMAYEIEGKAFTSAQKDKILRGFAEIESLTCLKIQPKTSSDRDYVLVKSANRGCFADLGYEGSGRQVINLETPGCQSKGTVIHEAMHALGIIHEHELWNRNDYINVYLDNAKSIDQLQQEGRDINRGRDNVPYSFKSIMHYEVLAFTKYGAATLFPKDASKLRFIEPGYEKPIAYSDVHVLNSMYKCADRCSAADRNRCGFSGHLGKDCKCICEDGSQDCDSQNPSKSRCRNAFDNSWDCFRWAAGAGCSRLRPWMSKYCANACGTCDQGLSTTETCINANRNDALCNSKAKRNRCVIDKVPMRTFCAKACKKCNYKPPITLNCNVNVLGNRKCTKMAKQGQCKRNKAYMRDNCRKACDSCKDLQTCKNTFGNDRKCKRWAESGECESNPTFMKVECANACKSC